MSVLARFLIRVIAFAAGPATALALMGDPPTPALLSMWFGGAVMAAVDAFQRVAEGEPWLRSDKA